MGDSLVGAVSLSTLSIRGGCAGCMAPSVMPGPFDSDLRVDPQQQGEARFESSAADLRGVAQPGLERSLREREVGGSNPLTPTRP